MKLTFETPEFKMNYLRFGSGARQLVILPGISVAPVTDSAPFVEATFAPFKQTHTVYLFDRRNDPPPGFTVEEMAEDTAGAMTALGIADADIYGTSQGGMMALVLAMRYPELCGRLALSSTMARDNPTCRSVMEKWISLARAGDSRGLHMSFFELLYTEEYCKKYKRAMLSIADRATPKQLSDFAVLCEACLGFDCLDGIGSIAAPALVLGAEEDRVLTANATRELARALSCEPFVYPDYGHAVYDEAPDFIGRLREFFS